MGAKKGKCGAKDVSSMTDLIELEVIVGPAEVLGKKFDKPKRRMTVGRERSYIEVPNDAVSQKHGEIEWDGSNWVFKDVGSSNGSRLNGVELAEGEGHALKSGDVLDLGPEVKLAVVVARVTLDRSRVTVAQYVEAEAERLAEKVESLGGAGKMAVRQQGAEAKRAILEALNR